MVVLVEFVADFASLLVVVFFELEDLFDFVISIMLVVKIRESRLLALVQIRSQHGSVRQCSEKLIIELRVVRDGISEGF